EEFGQYLRPAVVIPEPTSKRSQWIWYVGSQKSLKLTSPTSREAKRTTMLTTASATSLLDAGMRASLEPGRSVELTRLSVAIARIEFGPPPWDARCRRAQRLLDLLPLGRDCSLGRQRAPARRIPWLGRLFRICRQRSVNLRVSLETN